MFIRAGTLNNYIDYHQNITHEPKSPPAHLTDIQTNKRMTLKTLVSEIYRHCHNIANFTSKTIAPESITFAKASINYLKGKLTEKRTNQNKLIQLFQRLFNFLFHTTLGYSAHIQTLEAALKCMEEILPTQESTTKATTTSPSPKPTS